MDASFDFLAFCLGTHTILVFDFACGCMGLDICNLCATFEAITCCLGTHTFFIFALRCVGVRSFRDVFFFDSLLLCPKA